MSKVAIIYWSGTGNTEAMAKELEAGLKEAGADYDVFTASEFSQDKVKDYDKFALGCPAMGAEELEPSEFAPMFDSIKNDLAGKTVGLFGSYNWADGEWMRNWQAECESLGIIMVAEPIISYDGPDAECSAELQAMGKKLAE